MQEALWSIGVLVKVWNETALLCVVLVRGKGRERGWEDSIAYSVEVCWGCRNTAKLCFYMQSNSGPSKEKVPNPKIKTAYNLYLLKLSLNLLMTKT